MCVNGVALIRGWHLLVAWLFLAFKIKMFRMGNLKTEELISRIFLPVLLSLWFLYFPLNYLVTYNLVLFEFHNTKYFLDSNLLNRHSHPWIYISMAEQTKSHLPRIYSYYRSSFKLLSAFENKMFYNIKFQTEAYSERSRSSKMELFAKIVNSWTPLTIFTKKLHLKCSAGFWIRFF